MIAAASETLEFIQPVIPADLVAQNSYARLRDLATRLPPVISHFYLECRLGSNSQVDFHTCITARDGRPLLAKHIARPESFFHDQGALRSFLTDWQCPDSPLNHGVPLLWLEYDEAQMIAPHPVPNILFCVEPEFATGNWRATHSDAVKRTWAACERGLQILAASRYDAGTRKRIRQCHDLAAESGRVLHVSFMQGRRDPLIKLNILLPVADIGRFLEEIDWPGRSGPVRQLLSQLLAEDNYAKLDVAFGDHVAPTLGLEFFSSSDSGQQQIDHVERMSRLPRESVEKLEALHDWPGSESVYYEKQKWPMRLVRWLDTKIILDAEGCCEAKAYLGYSPRFSFVHTS